MKRNLDMVWPVTKHDGVFKYSGPTTIWKNRVSLRRVFQAESIMDQNALTVVTRIRQGKVEDLKRFLEAIGGDISGNKGNNKYIDFNKLTTTHFCRWVVIDNDDKMTRITQPSLAFETNYDGPLDPYLEQLARVASYGVNEIYKHCEGYPDQGTADLAAFKKYLKDNSVYNNAFYVAYRGRTITDVRNNSRVRDKIENFLDLQKDQFNGLTAGQIKNKIYEFFKNDATPPPVDISNEASRAPISKPPNTILLIGLTILLLPALILYIIWLRLHEIWDVIKKDPIPKGFVAPDVAELQKNENYVAQNQLTHIVDIKPGPFRLLTLKFVLAAVNHLAKTLFNQGSLGGIPTIHFARWCIIDNNKRLLFFSNFDGSWENYLGDFIDKAHVGLTGVWSNARGFPKTKFLVFKGATDEERFKEWARLHQVPTQVWYSAHPSDTVRNILNNCRIRDGVSVPLNDSDAEKWLQLL
jgi:hypothetical protein